MVQIYFLLIQELDFTYNNKQIIFSNNIISIKLLFESYNIINIKCKENTYECKKLYFNKNKEFIIESEIKTLPAFEISYDLLNYLSYDLLNNY